MAFQSTSRQLLRVVLGDLRSSWKSLFLTDIAFKLIAFVLLTPLVGVLFRTLIAMSGSAVVSDLDILFFFLGPIGVICAIVVGALSLGIIALQQASLIGILVARSADKKLGPIAALRFSAVNAPAVVRVTVRIVGLVLLAAAPFLAIAAFVYFTLLTDYDINYYLQEQPPVFIAAVGIGVVLGLILGGILLRLTSSWFFALPLVLFEDVRPSAALKVSAARARGHRKTLIGWIAGWSLAMIGLSALATAAVGLIGRLLMPDTDSLHLLAVAVGITLVVWAIVNLLVNLLSATSFAAMLWRLYLEKGRDGATEPLHVKFATEATDAARFQITRKRLAWAGVLGMVIAVAVGAFAIRTVRLDDEVQIMAHRGASLAAPENTMAAFRRAIEDNADWIELDVQETADGEVVVMHDSDFMKQAGSKLKIWDATMADLKDIDIGSWFDPDFKEERVPTLGEVLDACKGKIGVNIELKYYGHDEQLEKRVAELVDAREMASEVKVMSLKMDAVKKMKSIRPDWDVGLLMSVTAGDVNQIEADFLAVNAGFVSRWLIRAAHANGKEVYVWTVNDAPTMSAMVSRGVDGILTDDPALARSVLEQRAQMSGPERLLLELASVLGSPPEIGEQ